MTEIYSLPLPSSSDMNQAAHPGGGTKITDASAEGVVEDLFEAHLRHLDVATKSAVATKLAHLSEYLDSKSFSELSSSIDKFIVRFAQEAVVSSLDELKRHVYIRLDAISSMVGFARQQPNIIGEILTPFMRSTIELLADNASEYIERIRRFVLNNDFVRALEVVDFMSSDSALYGKVFSTARGGEVDMEQLLSPADLKQYSSVMAEIRNLVIRLVESSGVSGEGDGRNRMQGPGQDAAASAFESKLNDMYETFDSIDRATEEWGQDLGPDAMKKLSAELAQAVPNIGALNHLDIIKKRVEAGQYNAKDIPRYEARLKALEPILMAAKSKVEEIDARIISSAGGQ